MASRKGRVRPPVDSAVGAEGSGGRALDANSFFTGQELSQEPGKQVRAVRARPRQFRASLGEISAYVRDSLGLADQDDLTNLASQIQTVRAYAKNNSGGTLTRGQAVYISGADGTNVLITKAQANTEATSSKTLGLVEDASVAVNGFCWVVTEGLLSGVNTSSYAAGNALWLSPSTAGGITTTKPSAPDHMVFIGYVVRANANVGEIYVKPQNGFELHEIHDVSISTTPSNGQVLAYESSTSLWKPTTISGGGGGGSGDVTGPVSSTDNAIARFDLATGKVIQNSVVTVDDSGAVSGVTQLTASAGVITPLVAASSPTNGARPRVDIYEDNANGTNYIGLRAPSALAANAIFDLPGTDGTSGQVLKTDGSKVLSFGDVAIGNVSGLGTGVATFLATPSSANLASAVTDETGSGKLVFADTTTAPTADKVLKWNGSTWVPGSITNTTEFSFLVTSFSTGISGVQEIGSGTWKAAGAISFSVGYQNSSGMTAASIQISGAGVTPWASALSLSSPYTSGTSALATSYPTPGTGSYRTMVFTVTATRGSETPTATTSVSFGNRRFWGTSTTASGYTEAIVEGLASNELTTSKAKTSFTTNAATSYYVIYATPVFLGSVTFVDNTTGFAFSVTSPETVSVTNASGYTENYYVYRSTYSGIGAVDVKVS